MHWAKRWWHYRRIHRMFGFKFWAMVVGAAPLDPELEAFWGRLGFVVVQGYGLTETAPIVTLNHPLRAQARRGRQADRRRRDQDRRGRRDPRARRERDDRATTTRRKRRARRSQDGWFHTGDIGELDADGQLLIRGRKKEMIVTPEGLNVFPEDVERALNEQPGVLDSAVVGAPVAGQHRGARAGGAPARAGDRRGRASMRGANARARRSPEDPRRGGVAGDRAAADRRHAEAEAPRAARVAGGTAGEPGPPKQAPTRQAGSRDVAGRPRALRARAHDRADDDDRRARPDARSSASS